jgi:hypothetical protein
MDYRRIIYSPGDRNQLAFTAQAGLYAGMKANQFATLCKISVLSLVDVSTSIESSLEALAAARTSETAFKTSFSQDMPIRVKSRKLFSGKIVESVIGQIGLEM